MSPQALRELGLYDDTIIVFTSDNGGNPLMGGSNYPYLGGKSTAWEGGSRAPAFIRSARTLMPAFKETILLETYIHSGTMCIAVSSKGRCDIPGNGCG
jgi:hypothetical protein